MELSLYRDRRYWRSRSGKRFAIEGHSLRFLVSTVWGTFFGYLNTAHSRVSTYKFSELELDEL